MSLSNAIKSVALKIRSELPPVQFKRFELSMPDPIPTEMMVILLAHAVAAFMLAHVVVPSVQFGSKLGQEDGQPLVLLHAFGFPSVRRTRILFLSEPRTV